MYSELEETTVAGDSENKCKKARSGSQEDRDGLSSLEQHPLLSSTLLLQGKEIPNEVKEVMAGLGWEELLSLYVESSDTLQPSPSSVEVVH